MTVAAWVIIVILIVLVLLFFWCWYITGDTADIEDIFNDVSDD